MVKLLQQSCVLRRLPRRARSPEGDPRWTPRCDPAPAPPAAAAARCRAPHERGGTGREGVPEHGIVDGPRLQRRAAALVRRRARDGGRAAGSWSAAPNLAVVLASVVTRWRVRDFEG
jgi:hypothetical protein